MTADAEFLLSKAKYKATTGREQRRDADVLCYQIRQSFKPGEITPEEANRVGYETAMRWTKGKHAFFVATHTDRRHILDELSRFEMESLTLLFSSYIKYLIRTGQEEDKTFSTLREMLDSSDPYTTMEEADTVEEMIRSAIRHMPIKPDYYGEYLTYKATCENRPKVLESAKRILVAIDVNFDVFGMHKEEKRETTEYAEHV